MTSLQAHGPTLKYHRKLIQSYINTKLALNRIEELEEIEARRFSFGYLMSPKSSFSISERVSYGHFVFLHKLRANVLKIPDIPAQLY